MENRVQGSELKLKVYKAESELKCLKLRATFLAHFSSLYRLLHSLPYILCFASCIFLASASSAQDGGEEESIIELAPVSIEVVDTTQIGIPKERFRSFTRPDPQVYAPLSPKERPWYAPSTSVPEKFREVLIAAGKESLFSLTAQFGVPQALAYEALLMRDFGNSELLLNVRKVNQWGERTAELVSDPSNRLDDTTDDSLRGSFAYQVENSHLRADVQYDARRLGYLDENGQEHPNDRSLIGFSAGWNQRLSDSVRSSLELAVSNLQMEGPLSSGDGSGLDLEAGFGLKLLWPGSNPIDVGLDLEYFDTKVDATDALPEQGLKEIITRLSLRDNYIRISPFVLGFGIEFAFDTRDSSDEDVKRDSSIYVNPRVELTSLIGTATTLKLGVERYVLRQGFSSLYLDRDYVRLNPELELERTWDFNATLQSKLTPNLMVTIGASDKEIRDLIIFEEVTDGGVLSWKPISRDSARIIDFVLGWELLLLDGQVKQSLEYVHEEHDEDIPYRPTDRGVLTVTVFAPHGLELSLSGEFHGVRHVDAVLTENSEETLSSYFLIKPRISKTFGQYASFFLTAGFYVGDDDYQIWKGYGLPNQTVDLGLTLKF